MNAPATHDEERQSYAEFACQHAEPEYRTPLAAFYGSWRDFNCQFFDGGMREPHLALGRTAPRSLAHCEKTTDYGGRVQLTLNANFVFGRNEERVVRPWPADGSKRFLDDLLLRLTVRQYVLEVAGVDEEAYRGFGPRFVQHANRIGTTLGLEKVAPRRRKPGGCRRVASGWPHCVRPADYYGNDVTAAALELACCSGEKQGTGPAAQSQGLLELIRYLCKEGRMNEVQRVVERHLEWVKAAGETRLPKRKKVEAGEEHVDGSPLGEVTFRPEWLAWNGGSVERMARSIYQAGSFADLPLLADALEEAGCKDHCILEHLRAKMEHTRGCWVVRGLLGMEAE